MPTKIEKIAIRKNMKGAKIGKALIESFVYDYLHQEEGDYPPLYTPEELQRMVSGLENQYERRIYNKYIGLYNSIISEYNRSRGAFQQAQNGYIMLQICLSGELSMLERVAWLADFVETEMELPKGSAEHAEILNKFSGLHTTVEDMARSTYQRKELDDAYNRFLIPALRTMRAYNILIELVATALELPCLLEIQTDNDYLTQKFAEYNQMREKLLAIYAETHPKRHALVEELFPVLTHYLGALAPEVEQRMLEQLKDPGSYDVGLSQLLQEIEAGI